MEPQSSQKQSFHHHVQQQLLLYLLSQTTQREGRDWGPNAKASNSHVNTPFDEHRHTPCQTLAIKVKPRCKLFKPRPKNSISTESNSARQIEHPCGLKSAKRLSWRGIEPRDQAISRWKARMLPLHHHDRLWCHCGCKHLYPDTQSFETSETTTTKVRHTHTSSPGLCWSEIFAKCNIWFRARIAYCSFVRLF